MLNFCGREKNSVQEILMSTSEQQGSTCVVQGCAQWVKMILRNETDSFHACIHLLIVCSTTIVHCDMSLCGCAVQMDQ